MNELPDRRVADAEDDAAVAEQLSAFRECRTTNELNRLHIDYSQRLAPRQLARLGEHQKDLPEATGQWLRKIRDLSPSVFAAPQNFGSRYLADPAVLLFSNPAVATGKKHVLVAFSGAGGGLLMPLAVFLQALDSRLWDVAVVKMNPRGTHYRHGVKGVAADFDGLVEYLRKELRPECYRGSATFGVSSGGYPAVMAAYRLSAVRSICTSGVYPVETFVEEAGRWARESVGRRPPAISYVFGAENAKDKEAAIALQALFGGRLVPLAGIRGHNALYALLLQKQFETHLSGLLQVGFSSTRTAGP